jgi:hypothetical protein
VRQRAHGDRKDVRRALTRDADVDRSLVESAHRGRPVRSHLEGDRRGGRVARRLAVTGLAFSDRGDLADVGDRARRGRPVPKVDRDLAPDGQVVLVAGIDLGADEPPRRGGNHHPGAWADAVAERDSHRSDAAGSGEEDDVAQLHPTARHDAEVFLPARHGGCCRRVEVRVDRQLPVVVIAERAQVLLELADVAPVARTLGQRPPRGLTAREENDGLLVDAVENGTRPEDAAFVGQTRDRSRARVDDRARVVIAEGA